MGCSASHGVAGLNVPPHKTWERVWKGMGLKKGTQINVQDYVVQRTGWKTVRLFISSTFADFYHEREFLAKKLWPELRSWCDERRLNLVEVDMRWGVDSEDDTDTLTRKYLSEIALCIEDNGLPFFLNMTGERVGLTGLVSKAIKQEFGWIDGLSLTEMEILLGAYRLDNHNALFMMRKPDFLDALPEETKALFTFGDPKKQEVLREMIHARFPPDNICYYDVQYKGLMTPDSESYQVELGGLEETFAKKVLEFFKARITTQYPLPPVQNDFFLNIRDQHEAFMSRRAGSGFIMGRETILAQIDDHIMKPSSEAPLMLLGEAGIGKTAIMTKVVDETMKKASKGQIPGDNGKGWVVFYHFIGAVPRSLDLEYMLQRLLVEMKVTTKSKLPRDFDDAISKTYSALINTRSKPTIILIDGLREIPEATAAELVSWVPFKLAPQIRCVLSMAPSAGLYKALTGRKSIPVQITVPPMELDIQKALVTKSLKLFSKKMNDEQMAAFLAKNSFGNPLWLVLAFEELRVYGDQQKLLEKINSLPEGIIELTIQTIERWEKENNPALVAATLCLIEVSSKGLLEDELLEILGNEENLKPQTDMKDAGTKKETEKEARQDVKTLEASKWSEVYGKLRILLQPGGNKGLLNFYHDAFSESVRKKYLQDTDGKVRLEVDQWWHRKLADYFAHSKDQSRRREEYPVHLFLIGDRERLIAYSAEWDVFNYMFNEHYSGHLSKNVENFKVIGNMFSLEYLEEMYLNLMKTFDNSDKSRSVVHKRKISLCQVFVQAGLYTGAEKLVEEAIREEKEEFGGNEKNMAKLRNLQANIKGRGIRIAQ